MSWKIDPHHTLIEFTVKHMMMTTVRGRFNTFDGTLDINPDNPQASKAEGSVDVASIETNDPERDNHLRSADFFDVEKYPKMTYRSTRVEPVGENKYKVYGDLTIKDVTREVVFDVIDQGQMKDPWGNQRRGLSATAELNRRDFGLNWNVALEAGGWLVGDKVNISAELQAVQEQPAEAKEEAEQEAVAA
jgi:polyisoprenoid-binding protein YceI